MGKTLERVLAAEPDGVLVRPAAMKRYASLLGARQGPAVVAALDSRMNAALPGGERLGEEHRLVAGVEQALILGADAVKVLLIFGRKDLRVHADNVERVARVVEAGDRFGVPVMVETVLWGLGVTDVQRSDPALLQHLCRIGAELGADIVKAPYIPGAYRGFADVLPVPVVILGGGPADEAGVLGQVASAVDEGVRGVAIGRNVFQAADPKGITERLRTVVHGGNDS